MRLPSPPAPKLTQPPRQPSVMGAVVQVLLLVEVVLAVALAAAWRLPVVALAVALRCCQAAAAQERPSPS